MLSVTSRSLSRPLHQLYKDPFIDESRLTLKEASLRNDIPILMSVHAAIKTGLERARMDKVLGSSLQSRVVIAVHDNQTRDVLKKYADELEAMFVVSHVEVTGPLPENSDWNGAIWSYSQVIDSSGETGGNGKIGEVVVLPPKDDKCPRCWRYVAPSEEELCGRCKDVVEAQAEGANV
jgi:isoleucyl-tRNA synthetase